MTTLRIQLSAQLLAVLLVLFLGLPTGEVLAQSRPGARSPDAAPGKVKVEMLVVAATDTETGIDPRLQHLQRHLGFLRYSGYQLLDTYQSDLSPGGTSTFQLVGNRRVTVTLKARDAQRAQFRIQFYGRQDNKLLDTTLSVNRNGTVIVAGPKHGDGILILPLQARY
jgi:hypothetical protein